MITSEQENQEIQDGMNPTKTTFCWVCMINSVKYFPYFQISVFENMRINTVLMLVEVYLCCCL